MSANIIDSVDLCLDANHCSRARDPIGLAVHRFGVPGCHDAAGVARFCRGEASVGRKMAYNYVISPCGLVEQALPDRRWGWHVRGWSSRYIGIALLGDFRNTPPTADASFSLLRLCKSLMLTYCLAADAVKGHNELPGGSAYPDHQCPGRLLSLDVLRTGLDAIV
jgi:hypothetical protein